MQPLGPDPEEDQVTPLVLFVALLTTMAIIVAALYDSAHPIH